MYLNSEKRSRRGRMPMPAGDKRNHTVSARLNESEIVWLDEQRSKVQMQRGEYMRAATFGKLPPTIPEPNRSKWVELARTLANLNQIAHHMNQEGRFIADMNLSAVLADCLEQVGSLRDALMGVGKKAEAAYEGEG